MADLHEVETVHTKGMEFVSHIREHEILVDAKEEFGGNNAGPTPKPLLLASLAGCTGMDVVSLMNKMRVEYGELRIKVSGELTEEHPRIYHAIHIDYIVSDTTEAMKPKIEKAVDLSLTRYCGVTAMLSKAAEITHQIHIESK